MGASSSSSSSSSPSAAAGSLPQSAPSPNPTGTGPSSFRPPGSLPPPSSVTDAEPDKADGELGASAAAADSGPGTFEELHRKCKDIFPLPFEGARLIVNKGLSSHFQICHNLTMSTLQPSGYKFGCTYVGTRQYGPTEAYPVLTAEGDFGGNLSANAIHQFTKSVRCRGVAQFQGNKCAGAQLTTDYKGSDFVASLTFANPDILNGSGVIVGSYLQNVTQRLALGSELLFQYGPTIPGNRAAVCSLAGRYSGDKYQVSASVMPMDGGLQMCYYQKANDSLQVGVEIEGSLKTQECTAAIGYQVDLPNFSFKGKIDSNLCVAAVLEKKLMPLPFNFMLSASADHGKGAYRFGVGFGIGG